MKHDEKKVTVLVDIMMGNLWLKTSRGSLTLIPLGLFTEIKSIVSLLLLNLWVFSELSYPLPSPSGPRCDWWWSWRFRSSSLSRCSAPSCKKNNKGSETLYARTPLTSLSLVWHCRNSSSFPGNKLHKSATAECCANLLGYVTAGQIMGADLNSSLVRSTFHMDPRWPDIQQESHSCCKQQRC